MVLGDGSKLPMRISFSTELLSVSTSQMVFFFQAEDGIREADVTGVQTCALPIFPEAREHQGVQLEEPGFQPPVTSLGAGNGDRGSGDVETGGFQAQGGRHQGMFTSAATRVQHPPGQQPTLSQLSKCRLGPTDVPGRNSLHVNGIEILRLPDISVACQYAWTFRLGHDPP